MSLLTPAAVLDPTTPDLSDSGPYATKEDELTAYDLGISVYELRYDRALGDREYSDEQYADPSGQEENR